MNEIVGKLTNLGYEIFGVILPGFFCLLLLAALWWSLGEIPHQLSDGEIPLFSYDTFSKHDFNMADSALLVGLVYFLGHLLNWLSRDCGVEANGAFNRVICCLKFKIPKPASSYDEQLKALLEAAASKMGIPIDEFTWRRFYPVAKIMLAERLKRSLVSTYQNKYTLHRCITAAAAMVFWLCLVVAIGCWITRCTAVPLIPRWPGLILCLTGTIVIVWGFSSSFAYHWKMFGNTIVTESFTLLSGWTEGKSKVAKEGTNAGE